MKCRKILYNGTIKLVPSDIAEHLVISNQAKYAPAEQVDVVIDTPVLNDETIEQNTKEPIVEEQKELDDSIEVVAEQKESDDSIEVVEEQKESDDSIIESAPKKRGRRQKNQ